jgi:pimeloyl-ACP methyl ester carboxylesterase
MASFSLTSMGEYLGTARGQVHWKDYGGEGRLIVLVHGLGGSVANWDLVGPRLVDGGRVVALDLPGFGLSPPGPDWSLETLSAAVTEFIAHFGDSAVLFGNSLGALLSEMVASSHPRVVDALVLISPATPPRLPDPHIHWPTARHLIISALPGVGPAYTRRTVRKLTSQELIDQTLQRITDRPEQIPPELVDTFVSVVETRRRLPWSADAVPMTGKSIRRLFLRPSRLVSMIREIRAPTLVVQGAGDQIVSPNSVSWLCSLRPDWRLVHMEDTGHTPQIDAPERLVEIVRPWLDEVLGRSTPDRDAARTAQW